MSGPAETAGGAIRFTDEALAAFAELSHDRNPLHLSAEYARRTPFGERVVFGMAGVLAALRPVLQHGPVSLEDLRCTFPAPLFPGREYEIGTAVSPDAAVLALGAAGARKVEGRVRWRAGDAPLVPEAASTPTEIRRDAAASTEIPDAGSRLTGRYAAAFPALVRLENALATPLSNLPPAQLAALAWASYFCGMVVPGRQSLIVDLAFEFDRGTPAPGGSLDFEVLVARRDLRFGLIEMSGSLSVAGDPLARVTIRAMARPDPLDFSLSDAREALGTSAALHGSIAAVTGGSRGLGAQIAAGLALHGSGIVVAYRSGAEEASRVHTALCGLGVPAALVEADLGASAGSRALARGIQSAFGTLDILVLNASPPIRPFAFSELASGEAAAFTAAALTLTEGPLRELLPLLESQRGWVIVISSVYVTRPPRRFAHYVAAKAALEGLIRAVALEHPTVKFMIVRAPKVLTDQTNVNFDLEPASPATGIVGRILEAVTRPIPESNLLVVDP